MDALFPTGRCSCPPPGDAWVWVGDESGDFCGLSSGPSRVAVPDTLSMDALLKAGLCAPLVLAVARWGDSSSCSVDACTWVCSESGDCCGPSGAAAPRDKLSIDARLDTGLCAPLVLATARACDGSSCSGSVDTCAWVCNESSDFGGLGCGLSGAAAPDKLSIDARLDTGLRAPLVLAMARACDGSSCSCGVATKPAAAHGHSWMSSSSPWVGLQLLLGVTEPVDVQPDFQESGLTGPSAEVGGEDRPGYTCVGDEGCALASKLHVPPRERARDWCCDCRATLASKSALQPPERTRDMWCGDCAATLGEPLVGGEGVKPSCARPAATASGSPNMDDRLRACSDRDLAKPGMQATDVSNDNALGATSSPSKPIKAAAATLGEAEVLVGLLEVGGTGCSGLGPLIMLDATMALRGGGEWRGRGGGEVVRGRGRKVGNRYATSREDGDWGGQRHEGRAGFRIEGLQVEPL